LFSKTFLLDKVFSMLKKPEKTFYKKFAQLNGCCYICNHLVANYMRRDVFRAIAYPTPRAILTLLVIQAMDPTRLPNISTALAKLYQNIS